ncbi:MAG: TolC family protein [Methylococcaceae bacterium]|nr:TolC family protein [Methylococcaceae bacterium]
MKFNRVLDPRPGRPCRWRGLLMLALLALAPAGHAVETETLPKAVTIQQLLNIVREKSPRYSALKQRIERSRAEVEAAGVMPNPRLNIGNFSLMSQTNTMYDGRTQREIILEVPVLASGQLGARVEAAEKQVEMTEASVEADFSALAYDIWRLFVKLLAGRERIAILDETHHDMRHLSDLVTGREQAGNASRYDVLRIDLETRDVAARLENARNDLLGTAGELGVALGLPGWNPEALGTLKPLGVPANPDRLWAEAERSNPEIETARRGEIAAEAGLDRARSERWPVPSLMFGSAFTENPWGHAIFGGLSVELPVFDYGQGGMARAATERQKAAVERDVVTAQTRGAVDRAAALLARRQETRARFERDVLGKLGDLKAMGEAAYRFGKGSLLELLDATRSRTEVRLTHVDLSQAETEAEIDALRAAGLLVNTVDFGTIGQPPAGALPLKTAGRPGAERRALIAVPR